MNFFPVVGNTVAIYKAVIHIRPDSMGNIMTLIARNVWKINMVGTIQANCTGAPMAASVKGDQAIKNKTYEHKIWQHNKRQLP